MSSQGLPFNPVLSGGPAAPIESSTLSKPDLGGAAQSTWGAAFRSNFGQSPVVTGLARAWGDFQDPTPVSHDDAVRLVQSQGYDAAFIPKTGMSRGAINMEVDRQYRVKQAQIMLERGGGGGFVTNSTAALAAGLSDPSNIVLGPAFGAVADVARGGLAVRAGIGAAMGAAYAGGMESAQAHLTGHDEDIGSWSMLSNMTQSAALFGLMHGALGPRVAPETIKAATAGRLVLSDVYGLERSGETAVSPKGAVGRGQVMPETARTLGFDPSRLGEPEYNAKVTQAVLDDLQKKFPNDREAQAVGYNAGPGRANEWIKAGRNDAVLPKETQAYLARLRGGVEGGEVIARRAAAPEDERVTSPASLSDDQAGELRARLSELEAKADRTPVEDATLASIRDLMKESADSVAEKQRLAQVALAQYAADNPVSVDPFRSGVPSDPLKAQAVDNAARAAMPDALKNTPAPSSVPIIKSLETKPEEPNALAQQFVKDAKARVTALKPERGEAFDEAVNEAPLEHEPDTKMTHDEFTKSVQAAVQCAMAQGVKLAVE